MRIQFLNKCDMLRRTVRVGGALMLATAGWGQAAKGPANPGPAAPLAESEQLYEIGKQLFDQLAPPEVKAQFEFPTKEQWDAFAVRLQHSLESDSIEELAEY